MSKRNKRKAAGQAVAERMPQIRRMLDKGDAKHALKEARDLYRRDRTDAHRQLLVEACLARAFQLQRDGHLEQARAVYEECQPLDAGSPELQSRFDQLRIRLGLVEPGSGHATPAAQLDPRTLQQLADDALLHPRRIAPAYRELKQEAELVRRALEAIERGAEAEAGELLKGIPRKSLYSGWKLFARGLAAHYAGDLECRSANWDRLDPERPAFRIVRTLLAAWGVENPTNAAGAVLDGVRRLSFAMPGEPVTEQLRTINGHLLAGEWRHVLRDYRALRTQYANSHRELVSQVTDVLWRHLAREGMGALLTKFSESAPPPVLDPRWNRARALCAEIEHRNLNAVEDHWNAYLVDLDVVPDLRDDERGLAKGLVCLRLARQFVLAARDEEACDSPFFSSRNPRLAAEMRRLAVKDYLRAIDHAPALEAAHRELADLYSEMGDSAQALRVYERLVEQRPDDYEALCWLASHHLEQDCPGDSEPYVVAAARLRPRDRRTVVLRWNQRLGVVRHATRKRKYDVARRELEAAAAERPPDAPAFWFQLIRATIEYKAKNVAAAEQFLEAAKAELPEATPIWLVMHANAVRYNLDRQWKNEFSTRFKAGVTGAFVSRTAGEMAAFLSTFLNNKVSYTGFVTHQRALRKYLERRRPVAWRAEDLRSVLEYLKLDEQWRWRAESLMEELSRLGRRQFPQDPHFAFYCGLALMGVGPFGSKPSQAIRQFEDALELDKGTGTHLGPELVETTKRSLAILEGFRRSGLGRMFSCEEPDDDEYDDEDEYDDDGEEDGDGFPDEFSPGGEDDEPLRDGPPSFVREFLRRFAAAQGQDLPGLLDRIRRGELTVEEVVQRFIGGSAPADGGKPR